MPYEVQEIDGGVAGVFTYDIPDLQLTLAVMFSHHVKSGKFKVEIYPEEEKKNAEPDLYCQMNDDHPLEARGERKFEDLGKNLRVYYLMTTENPLTLELDIATVRDEAE